MFPFQVDDHLYIYLEYVHPGSINRYVREHCRDITESIVRNFTRQILNGLAYLHSTNTIHRWQFYLIWSRELYCDSTSLLMSVIVICKCCEIFTQNLVKRNPRIVSGPVFRKTKMIVYVTIRCTCWLNFKHCWRSGTFFIHKDYYYYYFLIFLCLYK